MDVFLCLTECSFSSFLKTLSYRLRVARSRHSHRPRRRHHPFRNRLELVLRTSAKSTTQRPQNLCPDNPTNLLTSLSPSAILYIRFCAPAGSCQLSTKQACAATWWDLAVDIYALHPRRCKSKNACAACRQPRPQEVLPCQSLPSNPRMRLSAEQPIFRTRTDKSYTQSQTDTSPEPSACLRTLTRHSKTSYEPT
ncbi:hypothetical protein ES703_52669 [subsurface metagenome]